MGWYTKNFGDTAANRARDANASSGSTNTSTKTSNTTTKTSSTNKSTSTSNTSGSTKTSSGGSSGSYTPRKSSGSSSGSSSSSYEYNGKTYNNFSDWAKAVRDNTSGNPDSDWSKSRDPNSGVVYSGDGKYEYKEPGTYTPTYEQRLKEQSSKPSSTSNKIYNAYGEVIGTTGTGSGGYTDYSKSASNAVVNPDFVKTIDNDYVQRYLTATNGSEPGFVDISQLPTFADKYLAENPDTFLTKEDLISMWRNKYQDVSEISNFTNKYANEFAVKPNVNLNKELNPQGYEYEKDITKIDESKLETWEKKLINYQTDPQSALTEIARAQKVLQEKLQAGDIEGAKRAEHWINQINDVLSNSGFNMQNNLSEEPLTALPEESFINPNLVNPEMQNMQDIIEQQRQNYIQQQQAELEMIKDKRIAELQVLYQQAVSEGNMSIREAEAAFNQKKAEIEQEAYLDAERVSLYAHNSGIQNSQQMVGLMQGENARNRGLVNQNMSDRDKRIADIRDRLDAILKEKNINVANVNSEYYSGLLKANADANLAANTNMFNLLHDDYTANREHAYRLNELKTQHGFNVDLTSVEHGFRLDEMMQGHKLDLEKVDVMFQNELKKIGIEFQNSQSLQAQAHNNSLSRIMTETNARVKAEADAYYINRQREMDRLGITEKDLKSGKKPEFLINEAQNKEALQTKVNGIIYDGIVNAKTQALFGGENANFTMPDKPVKPTGANPSFSNAYLGLSASPWSMYKYNQDVKGYNEAQKIQDARQRLLNGDIFNGL